MIRWLKEMLLLNILLVPIMAFMPLVCVPLVRSPQGAQAVFWLGPLSAWFYTLVYSQWSSAMVWQRAGRLKQWRADHGRIFRTVPRACGWLFGAIFFSYAAEFLMLFLVRPSASGRALLPVFTYSPVALCWVCRRFHV